MRTIGLLVGAAVAGILAGFVGALVIPRSATEYSRGALDD